jgi:hypothetical protein
MQNRDVAASMRGSVPPASLGGGSVLGELGPASASDGRSWAASGGLGCPHETSAVQANAQDQRYIFSLAITTHAINEDVDAPCLGGLEQG